MIASEKIRLYPNSEQECLFWKFSNVARFIYNECLSYKIQLYKAEDYNCSVQDLISYVQSLKYSGNYDWLLEVPEAVTKQSIKDLDRAYRLFFQRGNKGFPKFKKRSRTKPSFYVRSDKFRQVDSTHIKITGVKTPIRIRPHHEISQLLNPRISFDGKFWYLSYSYEVMECEKSSSTKIIGIDLGISNLAVTSDGVIYRNINKSYRLRKLEKRKKHLQRKLSKKYEANKINGKFIKTNNILKLERDLRILNRRLRNIRDTYIHQVTYDLVRTKPFCIVIEDLNVRGMLKNKHLSKAIQEQEFYKFRQYLTYKCQFYGVNLIVVDRFYPSSKTCSFCGHLKKKLSLSERTFKCDNCGVVVDRDLNASFNLRNYGLESLNLGV